MTAHHVYKCLQADGRPLYIGSSRDLFGRLDHHRVTAFWAGQVTAVTAKVYPSKSAALAAERRAIHGENPRFNVVGKWRSHHTWTVADFDDYLLALLSRPNTLQKATHIANVRRIRDVQTRIAS